MWVFLFDLLMEKGLTTALARPLMNTMRFDDEAIVVYPVLHTVKNNLDTHHVNYAC